MAGRLYDVAPDIVWDLYRKQFNDEGPFSTKTVFDTIANTAKFIRDEIDGKFRPPVPEPGQDYEEWAAEVDRRQRAEAEGSFGLATTLGAGGIVTGTVERGATLGALGGRGTRATRMGVIRNSRADWRATRDSWDQVGYGDILSDANRQRIDARRSPVVDEAWIRNFPEDAGLKGELLYIHHIGGHNIYVPLPRSRHLDSHMPGGTSTNHGGPGSAAPFYEEGQD
jgi:hypothetical protein